MQKDILTDIWEALHQELQNHITKDTLDPTITDDIIQEVFFRLVKMQSELWKVKNIRAYIYTITRNVRYEYYREKMKSTSTIPYEEGAYYDTLSPDREEEDWIDIVTDCCLQAFILRLPERYRDILIDVELRGIPQKQLTEKYHLDYSTLRSRTQRWRKKLKEIISHCNTENHSCNNQDKKCNEWCTI